MDISNPVDTGSWLSVERRSGTMSNTEDIRSGLIGLGNFGENGRTAGVYAIFEYNRRESYGINLGVLLEYWGNCFVA